MPIKRQRNTVCVFCAEGVNEISFRDTDVLRRFTSSQNKILPRKKTGSCAKHQRKIAREIKRAREMGLLGYRGQ
ncbi:MAG: 30S ribosomal protein S18 [Candidatus Andersenbacteria bacterium]|nr:30S ribosomal protein S18 [bacterium]MDZ4225287.1 30S ribosomal protein S18 [Candidatus Andersenbacteria bacterium]